MISKCRTAQRVPASPCCAAQTDAFCHCACIEWITNVSTGCKRLSSCMQLKNVCSGGHCIHDPPSRHGPSVCLYQLCWQEVAWAAASAHHTQQLSHHAGPLPGCVGCAVRSPELSQLHSATAAVRAVQAAQVHHAQLSSTCLGMHTTNWTGSPVASFPTDP